MLGWKRGREGAEIRFRVFKVRKTKPDTEHTETILFQENAIGRLLVFVRQNFKLGGLLSPLKLPLYNTTKTIPAAENTGGRQGDNMLMTQRPKMPGPGLQLNTHTGERYGSQRGRESYIM